MTANLPLHSPASDEVDGAYGDSHEPGHTTAPRVRRPVVVIGSLVVAGLLIFIARMVWMRGSTTDATGAVITRDMTGIQVAPGVLACAFVALAAGLALTMNSRTIRAVTAVILAGAGLGATIAAGGTWSDPATTMANLLAQDTGVRGGAVEAEVTFWPLIALVPSVALVVLGVLAVMSQARWAGGSSRFARDRSAQLADPHDDPAAAWDALSRGEDASESWQESSRP